MKLLLVEDDIKLSNHIAENLGKCGFIVTQAAEMENVLEILDSPLKIDFIILDRLLGSKDTKDFIPEIKRKWPSAPIIVLSAISTSNERTTLINLGVDDYIGKPFSTQELIARTRALLRRTSMPAGNYIQVGNLIIDSMKRIISVADKSENLPPREFSLLRTLAIDPTKIWSKDDLLDYVWGQTADVDTNVVESTIANVRKKLNDLGANISIKNLRSAGYWIAQ